MRLSRIGAASICLLILLDTAAAAGLTIFWYTDDDDLVPGKTPDMFIKPGGPPYGTTDPLGPSDKKDAEDAIGNIRGAAYPPAGDMIRPTWDPTLEGLAADSARRCDEGSGASGALGTAGEILVATNNRITMKEAMVMVMSVGTNFDQASNRCKRINFSPCDDYRQLMSASVTGFACSRATCPDTSRPYRIHCVMSPKPAATDKLYNEGTPCQLCPKDRGYCYNNLCVSHDDKLKIIAENPGAIVSCSAPCLNCGVRRDVSNVCSCHCPTGFDTAVDCSVASAGANPNTLTCGTCQRVGRPCLNGGLDSGEATCRCLCPREFKGSSCEMPEGGVTGGVNVPIGGESGSCSAGSGCSKLPPGTKDLDKIVNEIKNTLSSEINNYCKKNQENYIKCCGVGTLPTSGAVDFISASDIHIVKPVKYDAGGNLITPMYATAKGNNGLCRKTTVEPSPIVPVPTDVLTAVINGKVPDLKATCCDAAIKTVSGTIKDSMGTGLSPEISGLVVTLS